MRKHVTGTLAALSSSIFLGLTPIFGKRAILAGAPPLGVVAWRTVIATVLLFLLIRVRHPQLLQIYPLGLVGCLLAGFLNGVGSLFYYSALGRIDASLGQLLYSLYPLFVALLSWLDHLRPSKLTWIRIGLALPAVYLLTRTGTAHPDLIGMGMMLIAAFLYALHLPINQRVLYDVPAPTVTLFTLGAMSAVVTPAYLLARTHPMPLAPDAVSPVLALALVTFLSRLTLFLGVKHIGGVQTALIGLAEILVTVALAHWWLHEHLTLAQWVGALLLMISLFLKGFERAQPPRRPRGGWLSWIRPPGLPRDLW